MFITIKVNGKCGWQKKKKKVLEIFWNTKIQLNFQSSSAAALIKNCQTANLQKFKGHQVLHSESVQIVGDLDNGEWKKSPTKRLISLYPNFYHASFLQQGCQTCIRCARKNSSRYKLHSENEVISTVIGLKSGIFSKFQKNLTEFEQKLFGSVVRTEIYMSNYFFCEKYISERNI